MRRLVVRAFWTSDVPAVVVVALDWRVTPVVQAATSESIVIALGMSVAHAMCCVVSDLLVWILGRRVG